MSPVIGGTDSIVTIEITRNTASIACAADRGIVDTGSYGIVTTEITRNTAYIHSAADRGVVDTGSYGIVTTEITRNTASIIYRRDFTSVNTRSNRAIRVIPTYNTTDIHVTFDGIFVCTFFHIIIGGIGRVSACFIPADATYISTGASGASTGGRTVVSAAS